MLLPQRSPLTRTHFKLLSFVFQTSRGHSQPVKARLAHQNPPNPEPVLSLRIRERSCSPARARTSGPIGESPQQQRFINPCAPSDLREKPAKLLFVQPQATSARSWSRSSPRGRAVPAKPSQHPTRRAPSPSPSRGRRSPTSTQIKV